MAYFVGQRPLYVAALAHSKTMFTRDGRMPPTGPANVLRVLQRVNKVVARKTIDLSKTYSDDFVAAAR